MTSSIRVLVVPPVAGALLAELSAAVHLGALCDVPQPARPARGQRRMHAEVELAAPLGTMMATWPMPAWAMLRTRKTQSSR